MTTRLPAEWEPQDGVLLAWPHADTDWRDILPRVEPVFTRIAEAVSRFERVIIATPEPDKVRRILAASTADMTHIELFEVDTNDTWSRDFGPITIMEQGRPLLLDFGFNGWGLKFAANHDNQITAKLHQIGVFGQTPRRVPGLILEGGGIESDGRGTFLTTSECLFNANRNPHLSKSQIEAELRRHLGAEHILWLDHGYLAGDDTDSHIDTLARLCPGDTILYVRCDDPTDEHYPALKAMEEQLRVFRTRDGRPFRLIPLPWPAACFDDEGQRLPATYANFLIINGAVLVPTYNDQADGAALAAVQEAFAGLEIIGIDCSPLVWQHGSLHCVTMQIPQGVLK